MFSIRIMCMTLYWMMYMLSNLKQCYHSTLKKAIPHTLLATNRVYVDFINFVKKQLTDSQRRPPGLESSKCLVNFLFVMKLYCVLWFYWHFSGVLCTLDLWTLFQDAWTIPMLFWLTSFCSLRLSNKNVSMKNGWISYRVIHNLFLIWKTFWKGVRVLYCCDGSQAVLNNNSTTWQQLGN